ncbi:OprD family outer membrane porin [Sansalvadorimonas verongulae]|uniref:OprD family outer membrane porin n=1 Tax=Sansalvadorimonas verongulae TaxID=2172824 RepID=UPI0018AD1A86|nr:OprD family outer membrane porin [Sansalvadorimonas verongulae]
MKNLKASALGAAIAAAVAATSAQAVEVVTTDPSFKLSYKNYKWDEDHGSGSANKRDEWVHALIADFDTGYVNDVIGAVVTVGAADVISAKKGSKFSNIEGNKLYETKGTAAYDAEKAQQKANNIAGVQQAYLKAKYTLGAVDLAGAYGVKKRSYELYGNAGSRVLPASSYGLDLSASLMGATVYGAHLTKGSNRNDSSFTKDLDVDSIRILGANFTVADVALTAEALRAKDLYKKKFLKAAYTLPLGEDLSVDMDARYATAKDDGSADKYKSSYYNLNATVNFGSAYVGAGYNKTKDGDWKAGDTGAGDHGTFNSSLSQWADYSAEGEKAYLLTAGYNFADLGLPGLSIDLTTAKGHDAEGFSTFDRREYSSYISYAFDGQLDGLSLAWYHFNYKLDERETGSTETQKTKEKGNRLYLKYSVAVF